MKKVLFIVFVLGSILQTNAQKFQDTIPFRNDLGLIIIPMTFNGIEKQFVFDTGAQRTIAYEWPKNSLKPTNKTTTITSSSGRKTRMRYYKSGTINLGSRKVTGHRILNTPKAEIFSCYNVDGILGVDIIKFMNWKIDYKNQYLIMYPPNYFPEETKSMQTLDFSYVNNKPFVYLKRKKTRFRFLLDTGKSSHTNISKSEYDLTGLEDLPQLNMHSGSYDVSGVFTASQPIVFQFPKSSSNAITLQPIIYYNNAKSSKIGNLLWEDQSLFMSLKEEKLYVSQNELISHYIGYPCIVGIQKKKMIIQQIIENTDPWKMGLRQGDEIAAYDGKQFKDFCELRKYQSKISKENKEVTITLKDGREVRIRKNTYLK